MLSHKQLLAKFKTMDIVSPETGSLIRYSIFKNKATIHRYPKGKRIIYLGQPSQHLLGFYSNLQNDTQAMKEAYTRLVRLYKGDMADWGAGRIQYSTGEIPRVYGNMLSGQTN
jgi:hypothetical protein